jgi:N-acetylmuramoyl-L-alanine amidase
MFFIVSLFGNITYVHGEEAVAVIKIEKPANTAVLGEDVEISGFLVSKNPVNKIEVFVGNNLIGQATYNLPRQDVQAMYPSYPNSLSSGFTFKLNSRGYEDGLYQIRVVATDSTSVVTTSSAVVQFKNQRTPIMGQSIASKQQMIKYFESITISKDFNYMNSFTTMLLEEAAVEGVRADIAFVQMMKETNFLRFTGTVKEEQNNFAGIGATGPGVPGHSFADIRTGIRAVVQHLKAYASTEPLKLAVVDPRYQYVKKGSAPYVEWLGIKENPTGAGWASDPGYGYDIVTRFNKMNALQIVNASAVINSFTIPSHYYLNRTILGTAAATSANKVLYKFSVIDRATAQVTVLQDYSEKNSFTWVPKKAGKFAFVLQVKDEFGTKIEDQVQTKEIEVKDSTAAPRRIVIDPGHGGYDPGAIGGINKEFKEKDLNIRISQKIGDKLKSYGYDVIYTRNPGNDIFVSLEDRARFANDLDADVFISLHHDSSSNSTAAGTSMHYSSYRVGIDAKDIYVTYNGVKYPYLREGDGGYYINYNGTEKFVSINESTAYDATPSQEALYSASLAAKLLDAVSSLGIPSRGTKDHNLYVTRKTDMISVLIEMGFISNPSEVQKLADDNFQSSAAQKIADVINVFITENLKPTTQPQPVPQPQPNPQPQPQPVNKGWVKAADGTVRYYDMTSGEMKKGWLLLDGKWYYLDPTSGVMKTGWLSWSNNWYYLDPANGIMKTGWIKINNYTYYMEAGGNMKTGWLWLNNNWYYLDGKNGGLLKTGWLLDGGKWYYMYNDGRMATNTYIGSYRIDKYGHWV